MGIASSTPFSGDSPPHDRNRARRITFMVGPTKTAAHVVNPTGSLGRYNAARSDSLDPENIHVKKRDDYITEES